MRIPLQALSATILAIATLGPAFSQPADAPYGSAKFEPYRDIDSVKQLRMVWDFNFADPKAIGIAFNNLNALLRATAEFGPHEIDPIRVVIVSHGPEVVVFDKKNYGKYKEIVDRAAAFSAQGVKFEICRNAAAAQGIAPGDLHGFVTVVPAGPHALAYWQAKGYALNAVGATMPTPPVTELNKADIRKTAAAADGLVTTPSKYSVAETIDRFESGVRSAGNFQTFARIDFQAFAATQGGKVRPSQLSIFGGGRALQPLLPANPKAAIDLPLKVLAWEDESGKVWVTYNTGEYLRNRHPIKGNDDVLKRMTDVTESLVRRAVE